MSSKAHFQKIAQVLKSNGADGELVIGFREIGPEDIDISEPVFIYFDGLPVPFYFESFVRRGQNKAVARITGVRTFEDAEEVVGRNVWIDPKKHGVEFELELGDVLIDWELRDTDGRMAGRIVDFHDFGGNTCLEVERPAQASEAGGSGSVTALGHDRVNADVPDGPAADEDTETFLVPFHEDLIINIDEEHRVLTMTIPQGL